MKVLLVNPKLRGIDSSTGWTIAYFPLGLLYIAAVLEEKHDVDILDLNKDNGNFKNLEKYEIIGITSVSKNRFEALNIARKLKTKKNKIVLGGVHFGFLGTETLKRCNYVDYVVKGEGEYTLLELCDRKELRDIKGLFYRADGLIVENPDRPPINLDLLPDPARHLIDMKFYFKNARKYELHKYHPATTMMAHRGCPNACTFCTTPAIHGKAIRYRSVKNVVDEIEFLKEEYGIRDIHFFDDTFNFKKEWIIDFGNELESRNIEISYRILARAIPDLKTISTLKKSGCYMMDIGAESGSPDMLKTVKKHITLESVRQTLKIARELKINTKAFVMFGLLGESENDVEATIKMSREINSDRLSQSILMLFPRTELSYNMDDGLWFDENLNYGNVCGNIPPLPETLNKMDYYMAKVRESDIGFQANHVFRMMMTYMKYQTMRQTLKHTTGALLNKARYNLARMKNFITFIVSPPCHP